MNLFQAIYCNQYEELVRTGRDGYKARKNGIVIITVAVVLNLVTLIYLARLLGQHLPLAPMLRGIANGFGSGQRLGQLIAIILMGIVGVAVYFTFGTDAYYQKTIGQFNALPPTAQTRIARLGAAYLLGSIALFLLLIFSSMWLHK